jgi:hypothetical protein
MTAMEERLLTIVEGRLKADGADQDDWAHLLVAAR